MSGGRRLPSELEPILKQLYRPDFDAENFKLADSLKLDENDLKIVEKRIEDVEKRLFSGDVPQPLTEKEAAAVEQKVDELRDAIAATRRRISSMRSKLDDSASPAGQSELSFDVDLSKKQALRRAVRKSFGIKATSLTYSMYRAAIDAKRQLEDREAADYASGEWED